MTTEHELDLALAADLQAALLPKSCPTDCEHHVAAARNRMCGSVGGDFHDFVHINRDQFAVIVGDVVGHGVRAALLMAQIMGFLRSEPSKRGRPGQVITELNRLLIELGDKTGSVMPCSLLYVVIDAPTGIGFFVNAGHPEPLLCDRRGCSTLHAGPHNLLLGIEEFEPEEGCHTFVPGERMVLYTDGVTDAADPEGHLFGSERLYEITRQCAGAEPGRCADAVFDAIDEFRRGAEQTDDESILVVDRI